MRRLEFLISEVRQSTDNRDVNGIPTSEIVGYFNAAQRTISNIIFKANPYADMFKGVYEVSANTNGVYDLPSDIYSINAISMVEGRFNQTSNNDGYTRIRPIAESELSYMFGYLVRNNQVIISGQNNIAQLLTIRITYFKSLKTLGIRQAQVNAVTPGVSIGLDAAPLNLYEVDDHCSTVNSLGDQVVDGIYFTNTSGTTLLTTNTSDVVVGQYVVAGANSCNRSELPDSCEPYLLDYVRQRIYTRNNYEDAGKQLYFTTETQAEIVSIFSKNKKDDDIVPITDLTFLTF